MLNKFKTILNKYKVWFLLIFGKYKLWLLLIGLGFILYFVTVCCQDYFIKWQSLYGSLIGVGATILGVKYSLKQSKQNEKKEIANKILIQFTKYEQILVAMCNLNIDLDTVIKNKDDNEIRVTVRDVLAMYKLKDNKLNFIDFLNNIQKQLEENVILEGQQIRYYLGALNRMKEFISKFYIRNSLSTNETMNVLNSDDYLYYLPDLNAPHVELMILSDTTSFIRLVNFSEDCEIILWLKKHLEELVK